ncbi:MAG: class II glutamine amidotransferase [Candidatus Eisenbacteria sp.]|nr:class II glutamine amidotransferase [Candidatus Eisenbacteria bacterium]
MSPKGLLYAWKAVVAIREKAVPRGAAPADSGRRRARALGPALWPVALAGLLVLAGPSELSVPVVPPGSPGGGNVGAESYSGNVGAESHGGNVGAESYSGNVGAESHGGSEGAESHSGSVGAGPHGGNLGAVPHNCRLWGLIGSGCPAHLITDHLRDGSHENLMRLGQENPDGWGIGYFPSDSARVPLQMAVIRRGGPYAGHPHEPEYGLTVAEMADLSPKAAIAHVRFGTSGHWGIPNPHPFRHQGMLFAHNGGVREAGLEAYLDKYLTGHPPDYKEGFSGTGHIDSELLFLGLLKYAGEHPALEFTEALVAAVAAFAADPRIVGGSPALNFVLTRADTLYALHYYGSGSSNALVYTPGGRRGAGSSGAGGKQDSPYWAVASEPLGSDALAWAQIPPRTLAVFVPGEEPTFLSVDAAGGDRAASGAGTDAAAGAHAVHRAQSGILPEERPPTSPQRAVPAVAHNCRFWSLIGQDYTSEMVTDHLWNGSRQNLRELGQTNDDGWGIGCFLPADLELPLRRPLIRRGGPPARDTHEPEYRLAVEEIAAILPPAVIAHVRRGSSGHCGIPNPHPFQHRGILFAHNGGLDADALEDRLGSSFLFCNPPDHSPGAPGTGYIDSELYLLYLFKLIDERPEDDFTTALLSAVRTIVADAGLHDDYEQMLNFVLTRGDTLYALQHYGPGYNFEHYYPAPAGRNGEASPFWVVASESLGSGQGGWAPIPEQTLAVFIPGEVPQFLALDEPELSLAAVWVTLTGDEDGDGFFTALEVCGDPDCVGGTTQVSLALFLSPDGETWTDVGSTRYRTISGAAPDTLCLQACSGHTAWPDSLPPSSWELRVELHTPGSPEPVVVATAVTHPDWGLGDVTLEGADEDAPDEEGGTAIGVVRPNPCLGEFRIPVHISGGITQLELEISDISGRLVWRGARGVEDGAVRWSADDAGLGLAAGLYVCRLRLGSRVWTRRMLIVD